MKKKLIITIALMIVFIGSVGISQVDNDAISSPLNSHQAGFELKWDPNTESDLAYYTIYRSLTSAPETSEVKLTTTTLTTYKDQGLPAGVTFKYQVTATDMSGNESDRSVAAMETAIDTTPPVRASGLELNAL